MAKNLTLTTRFSGRQFLLLKHNQYSYGLKRWKLLGVEKWCHPNSGCENTESINSINRLGFCKKGNWKCCTNQEHNWKIKEFDHDFLCFFLLLFPNCLDFQYSVDDQPELKKEFKIIEIFKILYISISNEGGVKRFPFPNI